MAWISKFGDDMQGASREIPGNSRADQGFSTPDVYGRAVQLYLALERAAQIQNFGDETVTMWRGILTMLALRNMLDLPLKWNRVDIVPGDPLSNALGFPPRNEDQLLYPSQSQYQWDGQTFYVLSWAPAGQDPKELAIYSPMTLVYPVADWREVFAGIPQLSKFFYAGNGTFRNHYEAIQGGELNFVYPWLRDMKEHLESFSGSSVAKSNIILHLGQYMKELGERDNSLTAKELPLTAEKFAYTMHLSGLVPQLITAYGIGGPVFSDQLCVLRVGKGEGNPFGPCEFSQNYMVSGNMEPDVVLYAFLPIHAGRRDQCRENGLAANLSMSLKQGNDGQSQIHVSTSMAGLPGISLEKDYLLVEGESGEKDTAVYYKDDNNKNVILNKDILPLFSVWPTTLDANWQQYYIMRSTSGDCLRIDGERGTPSAHDSVSGADMGDSGNVVKIGYVPDAIPLVRILRDEKGDLTESNVSIGMATPKKGISVKGSGSAIVAVDFGTSSTRIFYTLVGNNQPVREILVVEDKPQEITGYERSKDRELEMSNEFISPSVPTDETLFSIFRRFQPVKRDPVRPLLDGAIYQSASQVNPNSTDLLMTDLKWNGAEARPYYVAFMKQLCLHIMTYLYKKHQIANIEWRYALPRALDDTNQVAMNTIWQTDVLGFLNNVSGNTIHHTVTLPPTPSQPRPNLPVLTESIAASRYFDSYRGREVNPAKGYLVVDIGGGSTDAALWQRAARRPVVELKWHASVRVAGRKMFTQWVESCIKELSAGIPEAESLLNTIESGDYSRHPDTGAREALVDRLMTGYNDAIHANYNTNITTQPDQWGGKLRNHLTQAVTLLMFSLGYQVGALMRADRYTVPPGPGFFTIAFGGRGSKVLEWLDESAGLTDFFLEGVKAAGAVWPGVTIATITSDDPKCEVARGLLVPAAVGAPTGWENVGNREIMEDPDYYADMDWEEEDGRHHKTGAATAFCEAFQAVLPDKYHIADLSDGNNQGELSNVAVRTMTGEAYVDDVFKVLMESVYSVLEHLA